MPNSQVHFSHDFQGVLLEQIIILMNASEEGILDGNDAAIDGSRTDGVKYGFERWQWHCFRVRIKCQHRLLTEGPCFTLKCDVHREIRKT